MELSKFPAIPVHGTLRKLSSALPLMGDDRELHFLNNSWNMNVAFIYLNNESGDMQWNLDDLPVFLAVVEQHGITAAARTLGMPKSTVSKTLSRLEQGVGLRLLDRNSRNLRITSEGETFYRQALLIIEQAKEADAAMAGLNAVPSGRLSVALPPAFCQELIAPNLARFRQEYPEIDLDLTVTSHGVDLLRDQVDIAVVVGQLDDSELIVKTLLSGRVVWVASPAYLGSNADDEDLRALRTHVQICEKRYGLRRMPVRIRGQIAHVDLARGITHVNDPLSVRRALINGAGVSLMPAHYCHTQLNEGSLVEVFRHISVDISASKLSAVYPSRRLMSPKTRTFLTFLSQVVCHL